MSLSITFTTNDPKTEESVQLASSNGWTLVQRWAEMLPEADYNLLKQLTDNGEVVNTQQLSQEIIKALKDFPPHNPNLAHTLQRLVDAIQDGSDLETITVMG